MECTICCREDSKLTPIDVESVPQHRLCDRCLSDLFTKDFEEELSSDSDEPLSSFVNSSINIKVEALEPINDPDDDDDTCSMGPEPDVLLQVVEEDAVKLEIEVEPAVANKTAIPEEKLKKRCHICEERFTNRITLGKHIRTSHPQEKLNRCYICRKFFKGIKEFEEHVQREHAGFSHLCNVCLEGYETGKKLEHEWRCSGRLLFQCIKCKVPFVTKEGLMKHLDSHDIEEHLKESSYQEIRSMKKIQTCVLCDNDQGYEEDVYWDHIKRDHDGRHLLCTDCGKTFRNRKHLRVHTDVQCKMNPKATEKAANIRALVQSPCQYCPKSFRNRTLLQNHVNRVHKAKPAVCDICGLSLATKHQMQYHKLKTHSEPTEKCPHCEKVFYLTIDLRQHLTTHEVIGKFVCELCGRTFKRKLGLEVHIKSHENFPDQPNRRNSRGIAGKYACELCDKRFKHNYILIAHMKKHEPDYGLEKKFECPECDKKFVTSAGIYYHMRQKYVHERMTCPICSTVIKGKKRYEEHLSVHNKKK